MSIFDEKDTSRPTTENEILQNLLDNRSISEEQHAEVEECLYRYVEVMKEIIAEGKLNGKLVAGTIREIFNSI